jgi:hypothetical protein
MRTGLMRDSVAVVFLCIVPLFACSVYDDNMPKAGDSAKNNAEGVTNSETGGKDVVDTQSEVGSGGNLGVSNGGSGGSGQTSGTSNLEKNGIGEECGDRRVSKSEKCDIGIPTGTLGACPTTCPPDDSCMIYALKGSGCTAECVAFSRRCGDGDGCCPPDCSSQNDSDCSSKCGDGVIETEKGETCEPARSTSGKVFPDPGKVCPTTCADDGDLCTKEQMSGSAANCNAVCQHVPITSIVNGDGCCPKGANASTDSDCSPVCGNGIREADEQCDGTAGCDPQCKSTLTAEQQNCIQNYHYANAGKACDECMCTACPNTVVLCYGSPNETINAGCAKIASCGFEHGCTGAICYCGAAALNPNGLCLAPPNGACKQVIEEADGTTDGYGIFLMQMDLNTAGGRARALGDCYATQCADVCERNATMKRWPTPI